MKRALISVLTFCLVIQMVLPAYAANNVYLNIIQKASETKYLDNDQGNISKTIIDSDAEKGEVTVEVKLSNTSKETSTKRFDNSEVFIIIPESSKDEENQNKILTYVETLAQKVLAKSSNVKIGVIGMKGTISDTYTDENGKTFAGKNDQSDVNGTADNAECVVELTQDLTKLKTDLGKMNSEKTIYHNNLQAALRLAKNSFSNNTNKILISLYDNVPSIAIGIHSQITYGGWFSEYQTAEEAARAKLNGLVSNTKSEILSLKEANIDFILLRPDDSKFDQKYFSTTTGETTCNIDGKPYADELYGTLENPTYGKMYSLNNDNLEKIVTEDIYQEVIEKVRTAISNVKIVDYFPEEIVKYFDFSYNSKPNIGTVSEKIDEKNTITWNIDKLEPNKVATLQYKLKIKTMSKNSPIYNKEIATNEKIILNYKDSNEKDCEVTLASSPKIKLSDVKNDTDSSKANNTNVKNTNAPSGKQDTTVAKTILPNAGKNIIIISIVLSIFFVIVGVKKCSKYKDVK